MFQVRMKHFEIVVLSLALVFAPTSAQKKNVVLIISDDMRPDLSPYVDEGIRNSDVTTNYVTPELDKLAGRSLLFKNAYCQFPICGPSRASFLTSRYPDTIEVIFCYFQ